MSKKKHHFKRPLNQKFYRPTMLIICEGETEYYYFSSFRAHASVEQGEVGNSMTFVTNAIKTKNRIQKKKEIKFDQTWLVFDRDETDEGDFQKSIRKAEEEGCKVAYSNQAFDYWFLLHFHDHNGNPMDRSQYKGILDRNLPFPYDKTEKTLQKMYSELISTQDKAIVRATKIYNGKENGKQHTESVSTVHKLVDELNKYN
ncbi:RloB family protein [bacterium]|nr:RloB family protein [bacterium]NUN44646.1 RloB domain-containing protein [bacterium]